MGWVVVFLLGAAVGSWAQYRLKKWADAQTAKQTVSPYAPLVTLDTGGVTHMLMHKHNPTTGVLIIDLKGKTGEVYIRYPVPGGENLHPATGTFCVYCGVNKFEGVPCRDDVPHTGHMVYCDICGAAPGTPCDAGLHS